MSGTANGRRPKVPINVRITPELRDELMAQADARVVSANYLVTRAIEQYLDNLPPMPSAG